VLDEPNAVALETLAVLADAAAVQPSAIVRFGEIRFGFDGATQMQRLFRDGLLARGARSTTPSACASSTAARKVAPPTTRRRCCGEFVEANLLALTHLRESIDAKALSAAVKLIAQADNRLRAGLPPLVPGGGHILRIRCTRSTRRRSSSTASAA
jgi:DNA-binding MurR/RpiR family transcriptional regulator